MLGWDIIAANGDVKRDQLGGLLEELEKNGDKLRLICVVGGAGAGKSTLAWRAAAELLKKGCTVLWIRRSNEPEVWFKIPEFYERIRKPFYVLVDDLFRDPEVVEALRQLDPSLPTTIIATSRYGELARSRLPFPIVQISLAAPSPTEKERALKKLGKRFRDLSAEERKRLDRAPDFGVMLLELSKGKTARQAIAEFIQSLKEEDEVVYRAYEYICFVGQYDLSIPRTLFERLDDQGRFFRLPERQWAKGVVSYNEARPDTLRGRHPTYDSIAFSCYGRDPLAVFKEIVVKVDRNNSEERRFIAHLCRAMLKRDPAISPQDLASSLPLLKECSDQAKGVGELVLWRKVYRALGQSSIAEACVDAALVSSPKYSWECNMLVSLYRERGREEDALPILEDYIRRDPETWRARTAFLELLERHGTPDQLREWIAKTRAWLKDHPEASPVRTCYLGLVERHAPDQLPQVLEETRAWLKDHPEDSYVRTYYLGLVERHAPDQLPQVLEETRAWLKNHPNQGVRVKLISLLLHTKQDDLALEVLREALPAEQTDLEALGMNLLEQYLRLLGNTLPHETAKRLFRRLAKASPQHKTEFANWLRDNGYHDEAEKLYQELMGLPSTQITESIQRRIKYGYGRFLLMKGRLQEAEALFREVLVSHKGHVAARLGLAKALEAQGLQAKMDNLHEITKKYFEEAEKELKHALFWAKVNKRDKDRIYHQLGWLYVHWERYNDALNAFRRAIQEAQEEHFSNYWGAGKALMALGRWEEALGYLRKALQTAEELKPPASEEIPALMEICLKELGLAN